MGLTVVKSDRVIQAAQLLQSAMHHPCSVTGNRQCLRLSVMTYGSQPLLAPVTRVKWIEANVRHVTPSETGTLVKLAHGTGAAGGTCS